MLWIRTRPFSTATPDNTINPTPADMLKGISRTHNAQTPPIAANGIAMKIITLCLKDRSAKKTKMKIKVNARGTTIPNRAFADFRFSKAPPYSMEYPAGRLSLAVNFSSISLVSDSTSRPLALIPIVIRLRVFSREICIGPCSTSMLATSFIGICEPFGKVT